MSFLRLSVLVLLPVFFWACQNKSNEQSTPTTTETKTVNTSIQGRVLNELEKPLQGATVSCGGKVTTTDINGNFLLEQVSVNQDAALVNISKNQYLNGARTLSVNENSMHYIQVSLQPREASASFSGSTGGTIDLPGGKLTIQANSVLLPDNSVYSGIAEVNFKYTNPEAENFSDMLAGDLRGIDLSNQQKGLQSFGMVTLELSGQNGQTLHLATNKPATLLMNIPGSLQGSAPAQIGLWFLNEDTGYWEQTGTATKDADTYTGTIKALGFWHFAIPYDIVNLKATVQDQNNDPIPNILVTIVRKLDFIPIYSYTDASGIFSGKVPANAQLILTFTDPCGNIFFHKEIGPYAAASAIEALPVTLSSSSTLMIDGIANDCNDKPVMGKITITADGINYTTPIKKGYFKMTFLRCSESSANVTLSATDTAKHINSITTINANTGTVTPSIIVCTP